MAQVLLSEVLQAPPSQVDLPPKLCPESHITFGFFTWKHWFHHHAENSWHLKLKEQGQGVVISS
jgi:hypothetical protein